jgi:radical SAM superfamily enzyme YgiQ (UPF0313 family)
LALYYLKSYLLKRKKPASPLPEVIITVFHEEDPVTDIFRRIKKINPRLIGFSCYIWNITAILRVCRMLKKDNPDITIVLGGPEVSPRAQEIMAQEKAIDAVVRGEGEAAFSELVARMGKGLSGVAGVSFREGKKITHNPARSRITGLSRIPSPYLNNTIDLTAKGIMDIPLETARGCSFCCGYCYYHKSFPGMRYFSLSRVEKEFKQILAHEPKEVYLMDATFNANPRRAKQILRLFIKHNISSSLHVELKAELVDEELAGLLRNANCQNIEIGIQSTNPKTLRAVNRSFNRERFKKGIGLLNKYNIFHEIQLIDALPYQSYADLKKSLDWLYALRPARVTIFPLAVLPGTSLRENSGRYGIVYDPRPPYAARESGAMSPAEVLKVPRLNFAMERLYNSHVFQDTFYSLNAKAKISFSEIFEDWVIWERRFRKRCSDYPTFLNKKSPEFLEFICRRHGALSVYKQLLPALEKTLADYLRAYYH